MYRYYLAILTTWKHILILLSNYSILSMCALFGPETVMDVCGCVFAIGQEPKPQGFNRSSHLGIHKQTNTYWSITRSETVFYHFKLAESGNYEAFVVVHYCQLHLIQPQILTNKPDKVTIITSCCRDTQLILAALHRHTPQSGIFRIKQMLALCYYLNP